MQLEEAFKVELNGIYKLKNKVFPIMAQQEVELPFIVYDLMHSIREQVISTGADGEVEARYQFDFYAETFSELNSLKTSIISEMNTWNFANLGVTGPYVQQSEILDYSYSYNNNAKCHVGTIEFQIYYSE